MSVKSYKFTDFRRTEFCREKLIKQHNKETTTTEKGGFSFMPNIPSYMGRFCAEGNFED